MTTSFIVPKASGGDKPRLLPAADMHAARLVQLVDLGTHTEEFQGEKKTKRRVRVGFELQECASFKEGEPEQPFMVSKELTLSLDSKATFRKWVEAMVGTLTEQQASAFDASALLGKTALVQVEHATKQDGSGKYAKIVSVAKLPSIMAASMKPQFLPNVLYHTSMGCENDTFKALPQFLRDKIVASPEAANSY
jgi:hypothetical protein